MPITSTISDGAVTFDFVSIEGVIDLSGSVIEDISRISDDGTALRKAGKKASPSTLTTFRDYSSRTFAMTYLAEYKQFKGSTVVVTRPDGAGAEEATGELVVLDVVPIRSAPITSTVGGLSGQKKWMMELRWTVISVRIPTDDPPS